jgi:hypothetical protein
MRRMDSRFSDNLYISCIKLILGPTISMLDFPYRSSMNAYQKSYFSIFYIFPRLFTSLDLK